MEWYRLSCRARLPDQILAVCGALHRLGETQQLLGIDEAFDEGDLLGAGDFQALTFFDDGNELRCLEQRVVGAGIEPGVATAERPRMKFAALQIPLIDIGDLEFSA